MADACEDWNSEAPKSEPRSIGSASEAEPGDVMRIPMAGSQLPNRIRTVASPSLSSPFQATGRFCILRAPPRASSLVLDDDFSSVRRELGGR